MQLSQIIDDYFQLTRTDPRIPAILSNTFQDFFRDSLRFFGRITSLSKKKKKKKYVNASEILGDSFEMLEMVLADG